jgi:hypothetical protein
MWFNVGFIMTDEKRRLRKIRHGVLVYIPCVNKYNLVSVSL